jgi:hypothetical protein
LRLGARWARCEREPQAALWKFTTAPPGPDWGWRIVLSPGDTFRMTMYNIWPEAKEELAVEATYERTR